MQRAIALSAIADNIAASAIADNIALIRKLRWFLAKNLPEI